MKVLICTDGSEFSKAAVQKACDIAQTRQGVEMLVLSAYELPGPVAAEPFISAPMYTQEIVDNLATAAEGIVGEAAAVIKRRCPDVQVKTNACMGRAAQVILDEADAWHPDLIVVGSHGLGFWGRALLGSVSSNVVHHAPCSVLIVRPGKTDG